MNRLPRSSRKERQLFKRNKTKTLSGGNTESLCVWGKGVKGEGRRRAVCFKGRGRRTQEKKLPGVRVVAAAACVWTLGRKAARLPRRKVDIDGLAPSATLQPQGSGNLTSYMFSWASLSGAPQDRTYGTTLTCTYHVPFLIGKAALPSQIYRSRRSRAARRARQTNSLPRETQPLRHCVSNTLEDLESRWEAVVTTATNAAVGPTDKLQ